MNDRAISVLNNYDIEVLRSWKGRGAILCETKEGIRILKEYKGSQERLWLQQQLLKEIKENGYSDVEEILVTKEGELTVKDEDMVTYYLKEYREGRECNIKEYRECAKFVENMAKLHKAMELPQFAKEKELNPFTPLKEFEKHNRELRKVRKYLKTKGQKSEFELALNHHYNFFYEKAEKILEESNAQKEIFQCSKEQGTFCHGDFQHHNGLMKDEKMYVINFEKFLLDNPTRDLSLFLRKLMEKNNWSKELGQYILEIYQKQRPLNQAEKYQLYYRLSYPEKFWKIVNFYYNSGKAWIPGRNMEKLETLLKQEEEKSIFLEQNFLKGVLQKA